LGNPSGIVRSKQGRSTDIPELPASPWNSVFRRQCPPIPAGWGVLAGDTRGSTSDWSADAESIYTRLERGIVPMFYEERNRYIDVMRQAIALNGSFSTRSR
jgi:hypothetical protein